MQALSPTGRCHTFDKKADGYVPGEGVVSILIKPLSKAIADGNKIHGVIKGSAINHVGRSNNPTSPRPELQTELLMDAWMAAGINPKDISYIEAHGTGTGLGDPIEINALKRAFKPYTDKEGFCTIGSTKAHAGHLEAAAGLTSVIKVLLMMKHRTIPVMPNFEELNPYIKLDGSPFRINTNKEEWKSDRPFLAGVSSFGMTGNNAHVVLEEYRSPKRQPYTSVSPATILLSARSEDRLKTQAENLRAWLQSHSEVSIHDIAYTLQTDREPMDERLVIIAKDKDDLAGKLEAYLKEGTADKGEQIDWSGFYPEDKPNKVSLPLYPFARNRYWVPQPEKINVATTPEKRRQDHFTDFSGEEFFLKDHQVNGRKVLPGVYYIEMARAAAAGEIGLTGEEIGATVLQQIVWTRPVVAAADGVRVHIDLQPEPSGKVSYRIYTRSAAKEDTEHIVHSQGWAFWEKGAAVAGIDIPLLMAGCSRQIGAEACYKIFEELGLGYGPGHRGMVELHVGENYVLSRLELPLSVKDTLEDYVLHPSMLDSALQSSIGLMIGKDPQQLRLPFSVKELRVYRTCSKTMWAYARYSENCLPSDVVQQLDIDLTDEKGNVCVQIRGFSSRALVREPAKAAPPDMEAVGKKVELALLKMVSDILMTAMEDLDTETNLNEFGFDSITSTKFVNALREKYELELSPTLFFELTTIRKIGTYLLKEHAAVMLAHYGIAPIVETAPLHQTAPPSQTAPSSQTASPSPSAPSTQSSPDGVAIIGMSGVFPGARDIDELWENLVAGKDAITEIPAQRWNWHEYEGDNVPGTQKSNNKWGGFIDCIDEFDPLFFSISPHEAALMDPQQRLLMLHVWKTLEDAGYPAESLSGSDTGIFVGTTGSGYMGMAAAAGVPIDGYTSTGAVPSVGPNRVSYFLDIHGPSEPIETSCSSSLIAIHRAVNAILQGVCGMALAGGVNTIITPDGHISFSKAGMLSAEGRCKTFSDKADGYVRGEGIGMLLLKKLSEAERDGDHIYGVIRGGSQNHGGRASSLTAPNRVAQSSLLQNAYTRAGIDPRTVTYIEAHGTGTPLGDPIEIEGLKAAFKTLNESNGPESTSPYCGIGSVKSNIGHLELAAGVAGVIKVLLQMRQGILVKSLHCENVNPYIDLSESPFYIVRENREWQRLRDGNGSMIPRRAGVSSFGFGGVNAHVIIEEYLPKPNPKPAKAPSYTGGTPAIIILSGKNESRLREQAVNLKKFLESHPDADLYDIAYTLQIGRTAMEERLAWIVNDREELKAGLTDYLEGRTANLLSGNSKKDKADLLLEGAAGKAYLETAVRNKESRSIARLWVKGVRIDWSLLYPDAKPRKISLPTYPFARERYWIPVRKEHRAFSQLHPLLHSNESDLERQKYTSVYTGSETFLAEHKVREEKILPGTAHLELAREAGERSLHQKITQLRDITWLSPIRVNGTPQQVSVSVYPAGEEIGYDIYTQTGKEEQTHSQGRLSTKAQQAPAPLDIGAIRQRLSQVKQQEAFYNVFKAIGLDHGTSFRGIETIYYSGSEALSRISLPREEGFVLSPGMLDSALQTCAGLNFSKESPDLELPFSVKEVTVYQDLPATAWCYVKKSANTNAAGYDIDLLNEEGEVLLRFKDFITLPLTGLLKTAAPASPAPAPTASPAEEKATTHIYSTAWQASAARHDQPQQQTGPSQLVLLAGAPVGLADKLKETMAAEVETITRETAEDFFIDVLGKVKEKYKTPTNITIVCQNTEYLDYGFVSGLLKTATWENPKITGKIVGVESLSIHKFEEIAAIIEAEQYTTDAEVRYQEGKREIRMVKELSIPETGPIRPTPAAEPIRIKEGGVYLITGGAGGLGRIFAGHISQTRDTRLILTGRRELSTDDQETLSEIPGAVYYQCDVSNKEEVVALIKKIKDEHQRLDGIIHSAGIIRDGYIIKKTDEDSRRVLSPKIQGARHLDEATKEEALDFIVFFSSLSAITGNLGQADYASANAWLDNYAHYRNEQKAKGKRQGKTLSIDWPLWKEGGMQIDEESRKYLEKKWGMLQLPTGDGIRTFEGLLNSTESQGIVAFGIGSKVARTLNVTQTQIQKNAPADIDKKTIREKVVKRILELASQLVKLDARDIATDEKMGDYGFDSILLTSFANQLNAWYELDLLPTVFYNYPTIEDLAAFLVEEHSAKVVRRHGDLTPPPATTQIAEKDHRDRPNLRERQAIKRTRNTPSQTADPIAIIGISGRFPGSPDLESFWDNIKKNKDLISEIPAERWDWKQYDGDPQKDTGKTKAKWGGFIEDIDKFDPLFFNISPGEAELMDPQHRITLEAVYQALEDAGIASDDIKGSNTGAFIGVSSSDYSLLINQQPHLAAQAQYSSGSAHSILVNRISYLLDIHGPSEPIDTACSSSLIAIHRAVENIRNGHCDLAIAGGVNALLSPELTLSFSQAGMLSADGRCKTFDQQANGYVRGEGVGVVILKPLEKAEQDGDHIYGVIRATAANHGGKANTLTSPNPNAQKELLLTAYRSANIHPRDVSYIEAHGTGTPLGDPIETEGLKLAFATLCKEYNIAAPAKPHCGIGSVKTNIGHLEAAAGIAGLMKLLFCLKHQTLPGNPHLKTPNEYLQLADSPFYLQQNTTPWASENGRPRIAGVSSFGFGGTNAHVIVEEYLPKPAPTPTPTPTPVPPYTSGTPAIIILSAKNESRLREQVVNLKKFLETHPDADLCDIAYTLQVGRTAMDHRLAWIVNDREELRAMLTDYLQGRTTDLLSGNNKKDKTDLLLEGAAGKAYLETAVSNKESRSIAQLWVKGVRIDWSLLYPDAKPRKISLPTYPFARERYWIPVRKEHRTFSQLHPLQLHPLLHSNESDLGGQKYTSVYTGSEKFLSEHKVREEKILPGTAYLELAREAGERSLRQKITQLRDITWLSPIRVNGTPEQVSIRVYPAGEEIGYDIYTQTGKEEQKHSQGRLSTKEQEAPAPRDLGALRQRLSEVKQQEACYSLFKAIGLDYGSSFRGIETLYYNGAEALSRISLPREEGFVLSPGMLDSALQACAGLNFSKESPGLELPFSVKEVTVYQELPATAWCYVKKSANTNAAGYDIDLLNEAGEVVLRFKDFITLPVAGPLKAKPADRQIKEQESIETSTLQATATKKILELASLILKMDPGDIETDMSLAYYGFDSILATRFCHELNEYYDLNLMATVLYGYPTINDLAAFLAEEYPANLSKRVFECFLQPG